MGSTERLSIIGEGHFTLFKNGHHPDNFTLMSPVASKDIPEQFTLVEEVIKTKSKAILQPLVEQYEPLKMVGLEQTGGSVVFNYKYQTHPDECSKKRADVGTELLESVAAQGLTMGIVCILSKKITDIFS